MKLAVAMSGGVDSSAAAAILKEQGHELVGFTMQLWNQNRGISVDENGESLPSRCCSLDDVYDARRVAEELGFPFYVLNLEREFERDVAEKSESQEICFVPDGDYAGFIGRYLAAEDQTGRLPGAGEIVSTSGEVVGAHAGIHHYTIGQRRGIGISSAQPLYVTGIDSIRNRIVV